MTEHQIKSSVLFHSGIRKINDVARTKSPKRSNNINNMLTMRIGFGILSWLLLVLVLHSYVGDVYTFVLLPQAQYHSTTNGRQSSSSSSSCPSTTLLKASDNGPSLLDAMSNSVAQSLNRDKVVLKPASGAGAAGGGGAQTSAVIDEISGDKYFIKSARADRNNMLEAEYLGVKAMSETGTIRVPTPVAYGKGGPLNTAFVVFEFLNFGGRGSDYDLGVQLAKMHRSTSEKGFGFHVDNTIGATPQPNPWTLDWAEFWDRHRVGHMLSLTGELGFDDDDIVKLRSIIKTQLSHNPAPSLVHGDLWGGNKSFVTVDGNVEPVIFDPATYYGDRETDVAMTSLFGGFGYDFYQGYESEWPLPEGHEKRREIYNMYHILNHVVLFGGMYRFQAQGMIDTILKY